ncbi:MAG: DUF4140 domain-containing protein [Prevotellaceae bacterium]|jgi:hypothetical protein|nr:DUF4140 domain-containing protein [Prevotellaceae bacterium]
MKKILFLIAMFLTASVAKTEDTLKIKSKVKEATVFFSGAEVVHEAAAKLEKGANMLVIRGLSPTIDINSIRIRANNGVLISSFEYLVETVDDDAELK